MTKKISTTGIVMMLAVITGVLAAAAPRKRQDIPDAPSGVPVPPPAADEPESWLQRANNTLTTLIVAGLIFGVLIVFYTNLLR